MDPVNNPAHYKQNEGWEAIDVTEQFNFNLGNALKYIIRCDHKGKPIEDLQKAVWYIQRELHRRNAVKPVDDWTELVPRSENHAC
jgi:hypothetical protein